MITLCVVGACSDGKLRETSEADANGEEERDAQVPSSEHDAEPADAALDAAASERDGEATGVMDATPAADAAGSVDGAAADAGAPCSVEAGVDSSCVAHLCEVDGGTALALEQDDPWRIGALDWTATVCGRSLGWPAAATSDARQLVYSLMAADVQQVQHGAPRRQTSCSTTKTPPWKTPTRVRATSRPRPR